MSSTNVWDKIRHNLHWLPPYWWQRLTRSKPEGNPIHLVIALADHFEPSMVHVPGGRAPYAEQMQRLERWCREYPATMDPWRDAEGFPFRHTYFYPAEQYDDALIERLAEHCRDGWGEIEIHLHHGIAAPDTPENTRQSLVGFRDALVKLGCLSRWEGQGPIRYAFVHGNWALANSARGESCGVDEEMQILADTGCYADFTLPSAPFHAQVNKINSIYECALPLDQRAPHRRGRNLQRGRAPQIFPLMVQGPLGLRFFGSRDGVRAPHIENGELAAANPPTLARLRLWKNIAITVSGRPDWVFIKLHCHSMDPLEQEAMSGSPVADFLQELTSDSARAVYRVHFVAAREMVNVILAACDGKEGNPGEYRDYRLKRISG
jgi:hypothetical protein